jgi:hypothetical protein
VAVFLSFFGDRRAGHRRGAYVTAAVLLVVMGVAGFVWLLAGFGVVDEASIYFQACWIVWGPAGLHRARRMLLPPPAPAALPVVALLIIMIVPAGGAHGQRAAETVKGLGDLREQGDLARVVLDVSTPRVCVAWASQATAPATLPLDRELLYLGQADSILALYDVGTSRPIRVSSSNVVLVELTPAERTTPTLRARPKGGR